MFHHRGPYHIEINGLVSMIGTSAMKELKFIEVSHFYFFLTAGQIPQFDVPCHLSLSYETRSLLELSHSLPPTKPRSSSRDYSHPPHPSPSLIYFLYSILGMYLEATRKKRLWHINSRSSPCIGMKRRPIGKFQC